MQTNVMDENTLHNVYTELIAIYSKYGIDVCNISEYLIRQYMDCFLWHCGILICMLIFVLLCFLFLCF